MGIWESLVKTLEQRNKNIEKPNNYPNRRQQKGNIETKSMSKWVNKKLSPEIQKKHDDIIAGKKPELDSNAIIFVNR